MSNTSAIDAARKLGDIQRDALYSAYHGPVGVVKRYRKQCAALVKRGLLHPDLTVTDLGNDVYDILTTPVMFDDVNGGLTYSHAYWYGTVSTDGRTVYFAQHGRRDPAIAVRADSIPDCYWGASSMFGINRTSPPTIDDLMDRLTSLKEMLAA